MASSPLRVAVAGTGFIGAVHVRSARLAGAHVVGVSASSAASAEQAAAELRVERAFASSEELVQADDVDVVHICTPEPPAPAARRGRARGRQARHLREAAGARRRRRAPARRRRGRGRQGRRGPVRLPLLPDGPRGARARPRRRHRPDPAAARHLPAGLAAARRGQQLARRRRAGRRLAHVRRHRLALVRPRRVRLRPPHHEAERAHADRAARSACTPRTGPRSAPRRPTARSATSAPRTPRSCSSRPTRARSARRSSARSRPGARTACGSSSTGRRRRSRFSQEDAETLWVGRREAATLIRRDPEHLSPPAARLATIPPGHPQGYADCFDLFVDDVYAEIRGEARDGVPMFGDGLRAAQIIEAVLASSREERWVDVAAAEPVETA